MTTEGDKFEMSTMRAAIHSAAEGGITAVDHLIDVFYLRRTGMESIYNVIYSFAFL